jgi:cytochrome c oxidase cbb3-type subunit III
MSEKEVDEVSGTQTTGHEWDGIKELDTPMPRWWLGILYATTGINSYTHGVLNYSQRDEVTANVGALKAARAGHEQELAKASLADIQKNADLLEFAMAAGKAAFGDNCVPCHGAGGQGAHGYPNLNDDVWLWGGKLTEIEHTIAVGVRSTSPETRESQMPAFGRDGILTARQIDDLTAYVVHLSGRSADAGAVRRATPLFADNCAGCHAATGKGDRKFGAPNLTDNEWEYGSAHEDIRDQIWNGHGGVMPTWAGRLSPAEIRALAVYVHNLGGGE